MAKKLSLILSTVLIALVASLPAKAAVVRWDLDNVTGDFGAETVTGFFDYNTITDSITNWSISAAGPIAVASFGSGGLFTGSPIFSYSTPATTYPFYQLDMETGLGSNSAFTGTVNIPLVNSVTNSAFIDRFDKAGSLDIQPTGIVTEDAGQLVGLSGTLDYAGGADTAATPLPGSLPLFLSGMLGLGCFGYRYREMAKSRKA